MSSTSSVIATAITPSEKASSRVVLTATGFAGADAAPGGLGCPADDEGNTAPPPPPAARRAGARPARAPRARARGLDERRLERPDRAQRPRLRPRRAQPADVVHQQRGVVPVLVHPEVHAAR